MRLCTYFKSPGFGEHLLLGAMQTWSISYTADRNKSNKKWLNGTMNYNKSTKIAHFYNEDGEQLDQLRQCSEERIAVDEMLELRRFVVEIGQMIVEEESVDDLFARLNSELGIKSSLEKKERKPSPSRSLPTSKIPTKLNEIDVKTCISCDFLFTRDKHKKSKIWHDGILKFFPSRNLGEFWDDSGTLLHKKVMGQINAGEIVETANLVIEIVGEMKTGIQASRSNDSASFQSKQQQLATAKPARTALQSAEVSSNGKRKFDLIFTADKHKKNTKKWIDGRVEWTQATGNAVFFNEDGDCFYKRILPAGQIEVDAEFESGQYLFQIGQEITTEQERALPQTASPVRIGKKPKLNRSLMATKSVPMTGRSDSELLSLLLSEKENNE